MKTAPRFLYLGVVTQLLPLRQPQHLHHFIPLFFILILFRVTKYLFNLLRCSQEVEIIRVFGHFLSQITMGSWKGILKITDSLI